MKRAGDVTRAIAYVRASTDDQKLSPEAQRDELARFAARRGLEIVATFEDLGVSGADALEKRRGMLDAIAALRGARAGVLLVLRRDRLARDVLIAATIESLVGREGAKIVSTAGEGSDLDGPQAALFRTLVDAFAAYERALIAARTRAALAVKRARGEPSGTAPFGTRRVADKLEPEPREARIVAYVRALRARRLTLQRITDLCAARGFVGRTGQPLALTQVCNILKRSPLNDVAA